MKILFIDDEAGIREQAKIFMERMDERFDVETASDLESALQKLESNRYDIVVADFLLPDSDGLDILKKLKDEEKDIPFILLTGRDSETIFRKADSLGAEQCLTKQGDPLKQYEMLSNTIIEILN
ncbi:MAG: response regulator [Thermoplasmatota archaeon]